VSLGSSPKVSALRRMKTVKTGEEPDRTSAAPEQSIERGLQIRYRVVWFVVILAVASVYLWLAKSGWARFEWNRDLDGYYDILGRAFIGGHLQLPIEPRPELLALADPWDPQFNKPYRVLDLALYNRHYYLYHGAAPALLFFAPWRLLTGHDLPESFAVFVLCLAGYLVLCELLMLVLRSLPARVPLWMFALFLLTLAFGEAVPYVLQRAMFYEIALASGFLFVSCGFFCLLESLMSRQRRVTWLFLCGLCFGLAAGCRPNLVLAAVPALIIIVHSRWKPLGLRALLSKEVVALTIPLAICCLCIAGYNYARFGNPLEFGLHYLMAQSSYQNIRPALANIGPGLYYFLFAAPTVDPVFPFLRIALKVPFEASGYRLPARFFNEGTAGIVVLCPLVLLAMAPLVAPKRMTRHPTVVTVWALAAYSVLCIFFISSLGLLSQRYEIDFQPYLVVAACILMGLAIGMMRGRKRVWASLSFALIMAWSILANLALAVQGPYDQFVQAHPESYFRLAQWFSPVESFRPLLNPPLHVYGYFYFSVPCSPGEQPLMSIGEFGSRYLVSEVCAPDNPIRIISSWGEPRFPQMRVADIRLERAGFERIDVNFSPQDRNMIVRWNGSVVLTHPLPFLFTAPSQVRIGWDASFGRKTEFSSRLIVPVTPVP
jgi:hypothetical protein